MRIAFYQDFLDGKDFFEKVRGPGGRKYVFIGVELKGSNYCPSNMYGPSYLFSWVWRSSVYFGSQGHLPVEKYKSESDFRLYRQSEPILFVED